jgi:hypothetical protein
MQAVDRIVASRSFNKSPRLTSFLLDVCSRAIEGRADEISEQQIGVRVFGKDADYHPGNDNVVRGAARQLRQRLALYYQEEGSGDPVRITLPRGGYVPHFEVVEDIPEPEAEPALVPAEPARDGALKRFVKGQFAGLAAGVGICAAVALLVPVSQRAIQKATQTQTDKFWSLLLPANGKTYLVPCDSGVVMVQNVTKKTVRLTDYSMSGYQFDVDIPEADSFRINRFGTRKYTSIADVKLAARLVRLPQVNDRNLEIRFGRDLRVEDLQHSNAILVGGPQGNPWIQLFDARANFRIESDDYHYVQTVVNKSPMPGEKPKYVVEHLVSKTPIYSIVSYLPNLDGSGYVLTVAGTSMAGIDAASEFLFRSGQFEGFLKEAQKADGGFRSFELLLAADSISLNALSTRIVGKRFHDPR